MFFNFPFIIYGESVPNKFTAPISKCSFGWTSNGCILILNHPIPKTDPISFENANKPMAIIANNNPMILLRVPFSRKIKIPESAETATMEILFNGIWRLENFVAIGLPIESYSLQLIKISNHNRIISYFLMPTFMTAYKDRDRIKNAMKDLNSNL